MASRTGKKKATSAKGWKKTAADGSEDLDLPSGNVALVKRPGLERLLAEGLIPDSLMPIAENAVQQGKKGKATEVSSSTTKEMLADKTMLKDVFLTMDRVAEMVVVEPKVVHHRVSVENVDGETEWVEIPDEDRADDDDKDFLYTDEVDFQDKAFIFQFVCGGTRDLERFRKETGLALVDVSPGEDVAVSA